LAKRIIEIKQIEIQVISIFDFVNQRGKYRIRDFLTGIYVDLKLWLANYAFALEFQPQAFL